MATVLPIPSEEVRFENQVAKVKSEIESRFRELMNCVRERERELLNELEDILNTYKRERDKHKQSLSELETGLNFVKENLNSNDLKQFQDSIIKQTTEKQKEFESQFRSEHISLDFDKKILELAGTIGRLNVTNSTTVVSSLPVVDYIGKVAPVLSIGGTLGSKEGQFNYPYGIAVHYQTGKVFVGDHNNNRIQVFDEDGRYLYKFGDGGGAGKMKRPHYIAVSQDKVFVSQSGVIWLLVYYLNGTFLEQIGTPGNGEGQFNRPHGITINESNGDIFVCDTYNNRVQIFSKDLLFKSQFGHKILKCPCDIKLTNECIYVLCSPKPFLYSFNYNLTQVQNSVSNSILKHLNIFHSFCIDGAGNFIIADYSGSVIVLFNQEGDLVHKITNGLQGPFGISVDTRGRIIVVGDNHHVLFF